MLTLGVVIPVFNEERTIRELLARVLKQNQVTQIVLIDDASTDKSAELIMSFKDSRITYSLNSKNLGKGASIARGIKLLNTDVVLIQDADLEYSPEEYPVLMNPINDGRADVVFGSRFFQVSERRALYYRHRMGNKFLTMFSNLFTNLDITDMETCYKVILMKYAQLLDIEEKRFGLEPEITAKIAAMKLRVYEVSISYSGRSYEEGKKITWRDGVSAIFCILRYNTPRRKRIQQIKLSDMLGN
jgi:glycosyltransferase involved in cell wall biosynthesis